tara:strand:+ start:469 stop:693 length:225 start_codon:yes stop_codon:yes gene_type:complete
VSAQWKRLRVWNKDEKVLIRLKRGSCPFAQKQSNLLIIIQSKEREESKTIDMKVVYKIPNKISKGKRFDMKSKR